MKNLNKIFLDILIEMQFFIKIIVKTSVFCSLVLLGSDEPSINMDENTDTINQEVDDRSDDYSDNDRIQKDGLSKNDLEHPKTSQSGDTLEEEIVQKVLLTGPLENEGSSPIVDSKKNKQSNEFNQDQKSINTLSDAFDQELDQEDLGIQDLSSQNLDRDVIVTGKDRAEIKDMIDKELRGKLSESQIKIVEKVTDSYLEQLFKKLLKRSIKKFVRSIVTMIFKEVRSAEKKNNSLTDRDMWVICKNMYDKELAREATKKKQYIQIKAHTKK